MRASRWRASSLHLPQSPTRLAIGQSQECTQLTLQVLRLQRFTFPNHAHSIPGRLELLDGPAIARAIRGELRFPELAIPGWRRCPTTTLMTMPEAAVHEDRKL